MTPQLVQLFMAHDAVSKSPSEGIINSVLLGWNFDSMPINEGGGLPEVARILAPALVSNFSLIFLASETSWVGDPHTRVWDWQDNIGGSLIGRLEAWILARVRRCSRSTENAPAVLSRSATDAARLFSPELWCLGGQIVLLVGMSRETPQLSRSILGEIAQDLPEALRSLQKQSSIRGLVLPGHDGDWARLFVFEDSDWEKLKRSLEEKAADIGMSWQEISREQFFPTLSHA